MITKLILDFSYEYGAAQTAPHIHILTSLYEGERVTNVKAFKPSKNQIDHYITEWSKLIKTTKEHPLLQDTLIAAERTFYDAVISPFICWINAIHHILAQHPKIDTISFAQYNNANQVFFIEAEGEANGSFLYKKYYYLPYYIHQYLQAQLPNIHIHIEKKTSKTKASLSFFMRGLIFLVAKLIQTIAYKLIIRERNNLQEGHQNQTIKSAILTRGIVQSQFIQEALKAYAPSLLILVSEQSFRPFVNYNLFKKSKDINSFYIESALPIRQLLILLKNVFYKKKLTRQKYNLDSLHIEGISFKLKDFISELLVKEFDIQVYQESLAAAQQKLSRDLGLSFSKVITMEMMTSIPFYVKKVYMDKKVVQLQTTLMEPTYSPRFIFADQFVFTDRNTYEGFCKVNPQMESLFSCISWFKYLGINKKHLKSSVHKVVFFGQPYETENELKITAYLKELSHKLAFKLYIKPHPRQRGNPWNVPENRLIPNEVTIDQILADTDLAITRISSVGTDFWAYGVPCLFVKLSDFDRAAKLFYTPDDYEGILTDIANIRDKIEGIVDLQKSFIQHPLYKFFEVDESAISGLILDIYT
ncbi:MAG: hypothetical protein JNN12_08630 [Bacteroidetes Order II. Incertae sedis bacterium]|nr:hypothetical protein [Bacteroidetes Order II. bacterium]